MLFLVVVISFNLLMAYRMITGKHATAEYWRILCHLKKLDQPVLLDDLVKVLGLRKGILRAALNHMEASQLVYRGPLRQLEDNRLSYQIRPLGLRILIAYGLELQGNSWFDELELQVDP